MLTKDRKACVMATLEQLERIKKLSVLKEKGILDEQEFMAAKAEILSEKNEKKQPTKSNAQASQKRALLNTHIMVAIIVFLMILELVITAIIVSQIINAFEN